VGKRITISLLIVLAIGGAAFLFRQPKEGSIEWHKRKYLAAEDKMRGRTWFTPVANAYHKVTGTVRSLPVRDAGEMQLLHSERENHRTALVELGYLVQRTFLVSNSPAVVGNRVIRSPGVPGGRYSLITVSSDDIKITAPPADMPKWERLIRQMDLP
jgi:hypothetical protein